MNKYAKLESVWHQILKFKEIIVVLTLFGAGTFSLYNYSQILSYTLFGMVLIIYGAIELLSETIQYLYPAKKFLYKKWYNKYILQVRVFAILSSAILISPSFLRIGSKIITVREPVFKTDSTYIKILVLPFPGTYKIDNAIHVSIADRLRKLAIQDSLKIEVIDSDKVVSPYNKKSIDSILESSKADIIIYGKYHDERHVANDELLYCWQLSKRMVERINSEDIRENSEKAYYQKLDRYTQLDEGSMQGCTDMIIYFIEGQADFFKTQYEKSMEKFDKALKSKCLKDSNGNKYCDAHKNIYFYSLEASLRAWDSHKFQYYAQGCGELFKICKFTKKDSALLLMTKAWYELENENYDEFVEFISDAKKLLVEANEVQSQIWLHANLMHELGLSRTMKIEESMEIGRSIIPLASKIDKTSLGMAYNNIGASYGVLYSQDTNKHIFFDLSMKYLKLALETQKQIGDSFLLSKIYQNISFNYTIKHKYCKSICYAKKAMRINKIIYGVLHPEYCLSLEILAGKYDHRSDYYSTINPIKYRNKIKCDNNIYFKLIKKSDSLRAISHTDTLGYLRNKLSLAYAYRIKNKYFEARDMASKTIILINSRFPKRYYDLIEAYSIIASCYMKEDDYERGIMTCLKGQKICQAHSEISNLPACRIIDMLLVKMK